MSKKLEVLEDRVLAAAEKCSDARGILKELFPDTFKEKLVDVTDEIRVNSHAGGFYLFHNNNGGGPILIRFDGNFQNPRTTSFLDGGRYEIVDGRIYHGNRR